MTKKALLAGCLLINSIIMYAVTPAKKDSVVQNGVSLRISTKNSTRPATPLNNSLWIDRNPTVHNYSPEELVKKVLLKSHTSEDENRVENVRHVGWNWDQGTKAWIPASLAAHPNVWGVEEGVTWSADERSLLYFERGPGVNESIFELKNGVLLSTGPGLNAEGPNETTHSLSDGFKNDGTQGMHEGPSYTTDPNAWTLERSFDRDLDGLTNQTFKPWSTCGSVLEFDFQPAIDKAFFDYIFASDEYIEGMYRANDVFGFFVTGPYDSPPGEDIENTTATPSSIDPKTRPVNSKQNGIYHRYNIARLPDNSPVGIDYINWGNPKELMSTIWVEGSVWSTKTGEYYKTTPSDYYLTLPDTMTPEWARNYFEHIIIPNDPTPGNATKYNMHHTESNGVHWYAIPTNPELFRYNYGESHLMEYDGYTAKLRAVADELIPDKWYHLKLVIGQTASVRQKSGVVTYTPDSDHGSGCFLSSLDLGKASIDFASQYLSGSRANSQFHNIAAEYSLLDDATKGYIHNIITNTPGLTSAHTEKYKGFIYSDCDYAIEKEKLTFAGTGNIILHTYGNTLNDYLKIDSMYISGNKVEYCYEKGTGIEKNISDYAWGSDTIHRKNSDLNGELYFSMKQLPEELNGKLSGIVNIVYSEDYQIGVGDTIFFMAFNRFETDVKYAPVTEVSAGSLSLGLKGGSKYIRWTTVGGFDCNAEYNDNCHWRFLRDTVTGHELPFSKTELLKLYNGNERIPLILQEPGSCWYDTIWIGGGGSAIIWRYIDLPQIAGMTTSPEAGKHYVEGHKDFSFYVTFSGTSLPVKAIGYYSNTILDLDSAAEPQADGSYKYTIRKVTEPWTVFVDHGVSNPYVNTTTVWTEGNMLHINTVRPNTVKIYTLTGTLYRQEDINGNKTIRMPAGFYIVDMDNKQYKVIIK